jgi:antitoxin HicB
MDVAYPARFSPDDGQIAVSFRDLPDTFTVGADLDEARAMAIDALATTLWFRLRDGQSIPGASRSRKGETMVPVEPTIALKIALVEAVGGKWGAAARIARALRIDHKDARRLLDPTQVNRADRLARALALFGRTPMVTFDHIVRSRHGESVSE